jgi:hypothetical protein
LSVSRLFFGYNSKFLESLVAYDSYIL